jgi:hypothetical protein
MSLTSEQAATIRACLDTAEQHSMRFTAAAVAMHGLLASGAANAHAAAKVAKVAYDMADAFLEETVSRMLPRG